MFCCSWSWLVHVGRAGVPVPWVKNSSSRNIYIYICIYIYIYVCVYMCVCVPSQSVSVNFLLLPQLVSQVHSKSIPSKLLHELLQARVVVVVREDDGLQSR